MIRHGMPSSEYFADDSLSSTGLRLLRQSPFHFYGWTMAEGRPERKGTDSTQNGTLVHCLTFEPSEFQSRYVIRPPGLDMRTKKGKAWKATVPAGAEEVTEEELESAKRQRDGILRLPEISALLKNGQPEVSAFWTCPRTQVRCKCRPDWVHPAGRGVILVDGKTCESASADGFAKSIWRWRYDLQAAWYSWGYTLASGLPVEAFVFAAVESGYPHPSGAYILDAVDLEAARDECDELIDLYVSCMKSGHWPAYQTSIQQLSLPRWARRST
jgi:hypothetical protein